MALTNDSGKRCRQRPRTWLEPTSLHRRQGRCDLPLPVGPGHLYERQQVSAEDLGPRGIFLKLSSSQRCFLGGCIQIASSTKGVSNTPALIHALPRQTNHPAFVLAFANFTLQLQVQGRPLICEPRPTFANQPWGDARIRKSGNQNNKNKNTQLRSKLVWFFYQWKAVGCGALAWFAQRTISRGSVSAGATSVWCCCL